jgi:hypothetical protein
VLRSVGVEVGIDVEAEELESMEVFEMTGGAMTSSLRLQTAVRFINSKIVGQPMRKLESKMCPPKIIYFERHHASTQYKI